MGLDTLSYFEEPPRCRCRQKVCNFGGIDRRVVHVQNGWWFPEEDGLDYGIWRSNAYALTSMDLPYCPSMGTFQLRALLCRVVKADAAEESGAPTRHPAYASNVGESQDWEFQE